MKINPEARMTLSDVQRHPWFTKPNDLLSLNGDCEQSLQLASRLLARLNVDLDQQVPQEQQYPASQAQTFSTFSPNLHDEIHPASQPNMGMYSDDLVNKLSFLEDDPSMSQFSPNSELPITLVGSCIRSMLTQTQKARQFRDICPPESLTRFYSLAPFSQLLPTISDALHQLGIRVPAFPNDAYSNESRYACFRIRHTDRRKCVFMGSIVANGLGSGITRVEFLKTKGDPLEWRRFFKVTINTLLG